MKHLDRMPRRIRETQILQTACAIVVSEGFGTLSQQRISKLTGFGLPIVRKYYPNINLLHEATIKYAKEMNNKIVLKKAVEFRLIA
jgi:AcrR family transcriptional regulator